MKPWRKMNEEQTYGWYPSVKDVYASKLQPSPYHLQCLYQFKESGYHNPQVEPPEPAFIIRGITPTPPPSRPSTAGGARYGGGGGGGRCSARSKSVPVPKFRPVPKMSIPTPMEAWKQGRAPAETSWGVVSPDAASQHPTPKPGVRWPGQQIMSKYDKATTSTTVPATMPGGASAREQTFGTPMPPREAGAGEDSGYVFIPTGDGGVEVHSPPPIYWPDSHPRPLTPQHSVSSRASMGSAEGIRARRQEQDEYHQQMDKEKQEKRKLMEKQRRFDNMLRQQQYRNKKTTTTPKTPQPRPPSSDPGRGLNSRRDRIQSATTRRDKTPVPKRPVYSARPASDTAAALTQQQRSYLDMSDGDVEVLYQAWGQDHSPHSHQAGGMVSPPDRPGNPLPPTPSLEDLVIEEDRSSSPDYQEVVDKYGWRAEVHGDPYDIKVTTKRLPYTVNCEEPVIPAEAPSVHMESKETFFLNTIPRRLATFDVHQDWLSEGLCAKKATLQKRHGGVNYRYKNFAFAY